MSKQYKQISLFVCKAVRYGRPLRLPVFAESKFLLVTASDMGGGYKITHKPTGYGFGYWRSAAKADKAMQSILDLDWDFGQRWKCTAKNRVKQAAHPKIQAILAELKRRLPEVML